MKDGGCTIGRITVTTMQRAGLYEQKVLTFFDLSEEYKGKNELLLK